MDYPKNQVLTDDARTSQNFYDSDLILNNFLRKHLSDEAFFYMNDKLEELGEIAATVMDELSHKADKNSPDLIQRTPLGEPLNQIEFDSAYRELLDIGAQSEMIHVKYAPSLRKKFEGNRHMLGFAAGQIYAMSELGVYCPLCMTDGVAHIIDQYGDEEDRERLLPALSARNGDNLYTGAMFLTEKSGGSDVAANLTEARRKQHNRYQLNGEKWFCSNVNADVIMTLARTGGREEGIWGLSLFMVEKFLSDHTANPMEIIRLKEKMGVRSMATAEVRFKGTVGKRIGEEGEGFRLMTDMINLSRIYNSVAAVAASRRAIVEAYQYLNHRITFGEKAIDHPMVRQKLHELGSLCVSNFYMVWRTVLAMDRAEAGEEKEKELLRVLTPLSKWWSAEKAVYIVRECMELMGGNGYIEDFVMPKLFRDVNVLPIWEGTGNILVLDVLRAIEKSEGLDLMLETIDGAMDSLDPYARVLENGMNDFCSSWQMLNGDDSSREELEYAAKPLFVRLIYLYQMALMLDTWDNTSSKWVDPALRFLLEDFEDNGRANRPQSLKRIEGLMGWEY